MGFLYFEHENSYFWFAVGLWAIYTLNMKIHTSMLHWIILNELHIRVLG